MCRNGSGKTTLAKHLVGLLRPCEGSVFLHGKDTKDMSIAQISCEVGFVFQNPDHQIFCPTSYPGWTDRWTRQKKQYRSYGYCKGCKRPGAYDYHHGGGRPENPRA